MYIALAALGRVGLLTRSGVSILVAVLAAAWFGWEAQLRAAGPFFAAALPAGYTVHLALWFFTGQQTLAHFGGATWPLPAFMLACAVASWHAVLHPALRRK